MNHSCKICNTIFTANIRALYCSSNCRTRAYYRKHKNEEEFKKRNAEYERQHRLRDRENINARRRERFINDIEYRKRIRLLTGMSRNRKPQTENNRNWLRRNPAKAIMKNLRNRGKRLVTEDDIKFIFERDKNTCVYCGNKEKLSIEHKLPVKRGGDSSIDNLCIACMDCNSRKGKKTVVEYLLYLKELP